MGWTSSSWLLWVCVSCSGLFLAGGQTNGCCTQCKSGYARSNRRLVRLPCNIPSEPRELMYRDCETSCVDPSDGLFAYCSNCPVNFQKNFDGCLSACMACPSGTTGTGNSDDACTFCPSGKYQSGPTLSDCLELVPCVPGQRTVRVGTSTSQFQCEACVGDFTTALGSQTVCSNCVSGKYLFSAGTCTQCPRCNVPGTYIDCPVGTTSLVNACKYCSGTQAGSYCPVGQEEGGCDGTQLGNVACKDCRAGHHKPVQNTKNCVKCPTGTFKVSPGTASCGACTNGPTNSYYGAWGGSQLATSNECPW